MVASWEAAIRREGVGSAGMSSNLKFIAIILTVAMMMFALAYITTPGRSRLANPPSTTLLMPVLSPAAAPSARPFRGRGHELG
jgi:hypothetical protein